MESIAIINGTSLSDRCDYSFGDHLGGLNPEALKGGFMKLANDGNVEFRDKCREFEGRVMTLFIDNIRLYKRIIKVSSEEDKKWVEYLMASNDLLELCASFPKNKFVIFCSHEDTPITIPIKIPANVLGIHAVNAEFNNQTIIPFPYGLQRPINRPGEDVDHRLEIMGDEIGKPYEPTKLLYINCGLGAERNNKERAYLPYFEQFDWATCRFDKNSLPFPYSRYKEFLNEMRDHKFMICPQGHGLDCHRNWELLYMRRVPVMKDHPYFRRLMSGFPVLFVNDWPEITENMLKGYDYLYKEAQEMSLKKLDLNLVFNAIVSSYENHQ